MRYTLYIFVLLFLASCQTLPNHKNNYLAGIYHLEKEDHLTASKFFEKLCKKNHHASCLILGQTPTIKQPLSIMQGPTNTGNIQLNILHPSKQYHFFLWNQLELYHPSSTEISKKPFSSKQLTNLAFTHLPHKKDHYRLDILDENYNLVDYRFLTTNYNSDKGIAIASCLDDNYQTLQKQQWQALIAKDPSALFLIGDNIYLRARKTNARYAFTEQTIWQQHVENRKALKIYYAKHLIPIYGIWDDHDYGPNNAGKDFELKETSSKIFRSFFPQTKLAPIFAKGPGISYAAKFGNQLFVFLDNRSFRDVSSNKEKSLQFGESQEKWLFEIIQNQKKLVWLIAGGQFFGDHHPFESFSHNFPRNFQKFLQKIKSSKAKVFFVSGDRHLTELQKIPDEKIGYTTYEITSSGLHAKYYKGALKKNPSPYSIAGHDNESNFVIIKTDSNKRNYILNIIAHGNKGRTLYQKRLTIQK